MMRVGNAPCSWGVIENVEGSRITWETILDEIAATGYAGTELGDWGFMPTDPEKLKAALKERGLTLIGSWVSVSLHDEDKHDRAVSDAVRTARLLRAVGGDEPLIILGNDPHRDFLRTTRAGRITPELGLNDEQWTAFNRGADTVARAVREETGLQTVLHPHIATYVETPEEIARFVEGTDPDLIGIAFDTAHFAYGGSDPLDALKRYIDRVWHVHLKGYSEAAAGKCRTQGIDGVAAVGQGVFCELAESDIDFAAILKILNEHGYNRWAVVEQDVLPGTGTPRENAQRNRDYLRSIGL
ncbi:MAG: xylose isomerase [Spirochaetaceae bacterium]|nr:MAG: xylose isomerase [Spirochaetaceae bacterium]